jgi:50S ribosomal subunit-associated GTPase HflX
VPAVVVANKVDAAADPRAAIQALKQATQHPIVPLSAAGKMGVDRLKHALRAVAGLTGGAGQR